MIVLSVSQYRARPHVLSENSLTLTPLVATFGDIMTHECMMSIQMLPTTSMDKHVHQTDQSKCSLERRDDRLQFFTLYELRYEYSIGTNGSKFRPCKIYGLSVRVCVNSRHIEMHI